MCCAVAPTRPPLRCGNGFGISESDRKDLPRTLAAQKKKKKNIEGGI